MDKIIEKLKELRKNSWHELHEMEQWTFKDDVINDFDALIKKLENFIK